MTKKRVIIIIAIVLALGGVWAGMFYWKNLRGSGPAFSSPSGNIANQIDKAEEQGVAGEPAESVNGTNMPLKLPVGFSISVFARDLGSPRVLAFDPEGRILVSVPSQGKVLRLTDTDSDGKSDKTETILQGLRKPHGLAFEYGNCAFSSHNCILFVAEEDKVSAYDYKDRQDDKAVLMKKLMDLPTGGNHTSRSLLFANGQLYVAIGSSCNVCNEKDQRRASILTMNVDGSNQKTFATGLRNTVFMAVNPWTNQVWGTDMGRDLLGDNTPPEEVNIIDPSTSSGQEAPDYGWPTCYGQNVHDTNFDKNTYIQNPCNGKVPPVVEMQAHSAPLGLAFINNDKWPKDYQKDLIVAFHGSWNRTTPTGYKLVRIKLDEEGKYEGEEDFITGWIDGKSALGRPVDVSFAINGDLYLTDDKAGVIYKVIYKTK